MRMKVFKQVQTNLFFLLPLLVPSLKYVVIRRHPEWVDIRVVSILRKRRFISTRLFPGLWEYHGSSML